MTRDGRGRFVSERSCLVERIVGGYWCRVHRRWADDGHVRIIAKGQDDPVKGDEK